MKKSYFFAALVWMSVTVSAPAAEPFVLWNPERPVPKAAECPLLEGVEFFVVKPNEPERDGYHWLHGAAVCWHKGRLYTSFGHNKGRENTASEQARGRASNDGGRTWGDVFTVDPGEGNLAVSHGVFLSYQGRLWAFQGAFYDDFLRTHTRAYVLNEQTGQWQARGVVVGEGFWPMQEPQEMGDGNWIMGGARVAKGYGDKVGNLPAVAISHGDDLTTWDLVVIPSDESVSAESIWGESSVIVDGSRILNISRWGKPTALASVSHDYGRTWTPTRPSNLPMAASKPYTGVLSNGQRYLICTTTVDAGNRRSPLTIAVSRPGENVLRYVYRIRDAVQEGPGESHPRARLAYPYAVERDNKLYVVYSNSGDRGGNRNSAELAIIPVSSLKVPEEKPEAPLVSQTQDSQLWQGVRPFPATDHIPPVKDVIYRIVHPLTEGWRFLHGPAVIEHKGTLFVSFAHNSGKENTKTETLRCRRSDDGGRTWTEPEFIGPGFPDEERHSHGVFLKHQDRLWAFCARFGKGASGRFCGLKTEAFILNEGANRWESQGIVADNCWPMDQPTLMENGNWIMGGLDRNWRSVVAISRGQDTTRWDTIPILYPEGKSFLETSVIVNGRNISAFIRNAPTVAIAKSKDFGRTWSSVQQSNYPMSPAQPFASTLSTGQRYLISNISNRDTLAIAVSYPGEQGFTNVWAIRQGRKPQVEYKGRTAGGSWAYPCAYEHDGKLYAVYSVRKLECEMAIVPIRALAVHE